MPSCWLKHNGQHVIQHVGVATPEFARDLKAGSAATSVGKRGIYLALYDTGANHTCVSPKIVEELSLPIKSRKLVSGVTGISEENVYRFHIGFTTIAIEQSDQELRISDFHLFDSPVTGQSLTANSALWKEFDVILGMDVLSQGILTINSNGTGSFSF